ncbi:type III PLP-dependent enzyme [Cupriavidus nantongensis]|uniref:Diaminopimelate decarboxylase n=1 Tax=Cupriavidus nantongensis TaxID=1796606 RepID=A0A142JT66_9BURK|nr:type III PLP-dependent enzyme [Cupriavidus nantongensis]AMR81278.1 diaminopimelate decarboxylase [Cupriavidus nantongensis]
MTAPVLRWSHVADHLHQALADAGAPLSAYVYDLEALRAHAATIAGSLPPGFELFYAIKANSDLPILQTLAPLAHGFEISSGGELAWVREHFVEVPLIFSGPGKTDAELAGALDLGVEALHVESQHELERLAWLARERGVTAPVLLRVNLAVEGLQATTLMMGGKPTPFGIAGDQLPACLAWLRAHPEIRLRGFHFHLMSHQLDADAHLRLLDAYLRQVGRWRAQYGLGTLDQVNVGGGIGVNYREPQRQFDWARFAEGLTALSARRDGLTVRFECGRYITAFCGYYAMEVIDVKHAFDRAFAVASGGTHHFRTPYAQGHSHPFRVLPVASWRYPFARPGVREARVSVVGQLCTPKDILAHDAYVDSVRAGDLVVFPYAGAYAWHISHHDFLRHPHPRHCYLPVEVADAAA